MSNTKLDFDSYQQSAIRTAVYPEHYSLIYPALLLTAEAGEFANKVQKWMRGDCDVITPERSKEMAKELGGVLWALAACAEDLGYDLSYIAHLNIDQLTDRAARGVIKGDGDNR